MFKESAVDLNSALILPLACILLSVCSLHFTLSLHFTPGPQSAVRSLRFTLTAIEITGHCIPLPDKVNRMNAPLSILGHFIYTLNLNEE